MQIPRNEEFYLVEGHALLLVGMDLQPVLVCQVCKHPFALESDTRPGCAGPVFACGGCSKVLTPDEVWLYTDKLLCILMASRLRMEKKVGSWDWLTLFIRFVLNVLSARCWPLEREKPKVFGL